MKFEVDHHPETLIAMDIPKQTIHSGQAQSLKSESANASSKVISDISELKLEAGKTYTATVIQAKEPLSSQKPEQPSNQALTPKDVLQTSDEKKGLLNKTQQISPKEWIVSVNGKLALISSEKQLEIGQKLLLALENSKAGNKPALIAQLLDSKGTTIKPSFTNQASHIQSTPTHHLTNQLAASSINIEQLLRSLNITLDKQLSLQNGLNQLNSLQKSETINTQLRPTAPNQIDIKIIETIKHNLLDTLPKLTDIIQPNNQLSGTSNINKQSIQTIKESVLNSGLFFEKSLIAKPENLAVLKEKITALQNIVNADALNKSTPASLGQTNPNNPQNAIYKIQQTIESLLHIASKDKTQTTATPQPAINDLKANLLSLTTILNTHLAKSLNEAELKQLFLSSILDESIISPFSFPIIPNAQTKPTQTLFDKQELSTGQILKLLAGMIHKLQFNQLHSLLQSNTNNDNLMQQTWFFELPVLNPNQGVQSFNVRIDQEEKNNQEHAGDVEKEHQWTLLLSFNLSGLGPMYVQVILTKETVSSVLWAENPATLALLEKESDHFKEQLKKTGLIVGDILCQQGQPQTVKTKIDRHLVDTKV